MGRLITVLRRVGDALGNRGAVANASSMGAARRHEDWMVGSLERSVAATDAALLRRSA